jgi:hypothetical protein
MAPRKSAKPTKKLTVSAAAAAILYAILAGFTDADKELEQAINVVVPLVLAYFVKNDDTPGGVPVATR